MQELNIQFEFVVSLSKIVLQKYIFFFINTIV
jgi:hypothetical protein